MTASPWIAAWAGLVPADAAVLDVAAGKGRHTRFFAERGHPVTAIDRDVSGLPIADAIEIIAADLEDGSPWPLAGRTFGAVVVTNYLHRPLFPVLLDSVGPGGVLLYETFMIGNERFGKPSRPEFLLRRRRAAGAGARPLLGDRLRGADDQRTQDGDGPADRSALVILRRSRRILRLSDPSQMLGMTAKGRHSAAFATAALCSTGAAYFRSCCSDGTMLRASSTLARSMSAITKPAFSPPASASTSPHGAMAIEWP